MLLCATARLLECLLSRCWSWPALCTSCVNSREQGSALLQGFGARFTQNCKRNSLAVTPHWRGAGAARFTGRVKRTNKCTVLIVIAREMSGAAAKCTAESRAAIQWVLYPRPMLLCEITRGNPTGGSVQDFAPCGAATPLLPFKGPPGVNTTSCWAAGLSPSYVVWCPAPASACLSVVLRQRYRLVPVCAQNPHVARSNGPRWRVLHTDEGSLALAAVGDSASERTVLPPQCRTTLISLPVAVRLWHMAGCPLEERRLG